jgi:hypothetical protein
VRTTPARGSVDRLAAWESILPSVADEAAPERAYEAPLCSAPVRRTGAHVHVFRPARRPCEDGAPGPVTAERLLEDMRTVNRMTPSKINDNQLQFGIRLAPRPRHLGLLARELNAIGQSGLAEWLVKQGKRRG